LITHALTLRERSLAKVRSITEINNLKGITMWYPGYDEGTYLKLLESETNRELLTCRGRYQSLHRQHRHRLFPAREKAPDATMAKAVARVVSRISQSIGKGLHNFRQRVLPRI
jgi:hypothetical protein